jgi:hypothetical protein
VSVFGGSVSIGPFLEPLVETAAVGIAIEGEAFITEPKSTRIAIVDQLALHLSFASHTSLEGICLALVALGISWLDRNELLKSDSCE